jgi:hypothetical protein
MITKRISDHYEKWQYSDRAIARQATYPKAPDVPIHETARQKIVYLRSLNAASLLFSWN